MSGISIRILAWSLLGCLSAGLVAGAAADVEGAASRAIAAQEAGDWHTAVSQWTAAHTALAPGERQSARAAAIVYEWGRALGVICRFEQSEQRLLEALALDEKFRGPVAMSLVELSRLHLDSGQPRRALPWFERAVRALDAQDAAGSDAEAYADFLDEYALAAEQAGDLPRARAQRQRIEALKTQHSHAHGHAERTPYGSRCVESGGDPPAPTRSANDAGPHD